MKNIAMWAIIVFLTIGLYNMFKNPQTNIRGGDKVIFSEFLTSVENGEVLKVFEEPGKNNASDDDDPFTVSDADTMIKYLKENAG